MIIKQHGKWIYEDEDIFYNKIRPLLDQYRIGLVLFDPNEELLIRYDSKAPFDFYRGE